METLMVLVLIIGGGLWAYRQWQAIREQGRPAPPARYYPSPPDREPPSVIIEAAETAYTPGKPAVSQGKPGGMNKYLLAGLCAAWIICPFDFDFVPVLGWTDDVAAAVIGLRALLRS